VEQCYLIRGTGHQRPLLRDHGPSGTGPPMTGLVG